MANQRIYLRCDVCGDERFLAKRLAAGPFHTVAGLEGRLDEWLVEHNHGVNPDHFSINYEHGSNYDHRPRTTIPEPPEP